MATLNEVNQRCLALKLEFLKDEKGRMFNAFDDYVDKIIVAGKQWAENENAQGLPYLEMFQKIDTAVEFLCLKQKDLSENDKYSLQTNTENVVTRQKVAEKISEQVLSQENDVGTSFSNELSKIWKKFDTNETEIKKMTKKLDKIQNLPSELLKLKQLSTNQDTKLQKLTTGLQKLQNLKQELQALSTNQENKLQNLKKNLSETSTNQDNKFQKVNEEIQTLSANQVKLQDEIYSKIDEDLEKNRADTINETEVMKDFVMSAMDKNDSLLKVLSFRTESLEKVTADLTDEMNTNNETLKTFVTKVESREVALEEIEGRLMQVETGDTIYLQVLQTKLDDVEANSKILCQMLANRLQPIEQLRHMLNEKFKNRDENIIKLQDLAKEVTAITPRISTLEMQPSRPIIGFTASTMAGKNIAGKHVIFPYADVHCNVGGYFNPLSGIFTVPVDGLYLVSVQLTYFDEESFCKISVICKSAAVYNRTQKNVCCVSTNMDIRHSCDLGLVKMNSGDSLHAKARFLKKDNIKSGTIKLSCFMIG